MRTRVIACETIGEEIQSFLPEGVQLTLMRFGFHLDPDKLNASLQEAIDETPAEVDTILLGYGMCSKGAIGLRSRRARLVLPRVDDCISMLFGSKAAYLAQHLKTPGTFYLTRGWIECGDDPYTEYLKMAERYGEEMALELEKMVIQHYTRLALISTESGQAEKYREYARKEAAFFGLDYEEITGTNVLIKKMIAGDWDEDFIVVGPGEAIEFEMFQK